MKRFRFPLRPVSVVRAHNEARAREKFAAAVHDYVGCEQELARIRGRIADLNSALFESRGERFDAGGQATYLADFRHESAAEIPAERAVIAARAEMERCRADYVENRREMEAINRIEERSRAAYRAAVLRGEQAEFDELSGHRAARRSAVSL
jgi:flagellar export protein FliJ